MHLYGCSMGSSSSSSSSSSDKRNPPTSAQYQTSPYVAPVYEPGDTLHNVNTYFKTGHAAEDFIGKSYSEAPGTVLFNPSTMQPYSVGGGQ